MHVPAAFACDDRAALHDFVEQHSFGVMISHDGTTQVASHLPLLLDRDRGAHGTLVGHLARANDQWRHCADTEVLCVFHGPHAYVSPRWYQEERVVPTWNYVAVHTRGRFCIIDEPTQRLSVLRRYVEFYESREPDPWTLDESDTEFVAKLAQQTVAFEIPLTSMQGIWKLSQNHSEARRDRVTEALGARPDDNAREIAALMRAMR